jgi:hypothetical protein
MEMIMKISEFEKKFTIEPDNDIEPYFKKEREFRMENAQRKSCLNCHDEPNNEWLKSSAWTAVQHCWKCKSINVVFPADRMSGNFEDAVCIYKEKDNQ